MNRSALFTAYNAAKPLARAGFIDAERLNRALGVAQQKRPARLYATTLTSCDCPDARYRRVTCKHRLSLHLLAAAS